jgi:hypothetical protein
LIRIILTFCMGKHYSLVQELCPEISQEGKFHTKEKGPANRPFLVEVG